MKNKVKILRVGKGLTQTELAEMLNISRSLLIKIESGIAVPNTNVALNIAAIFNSTVEDIFGSKF